jgi:hypothetical protein
MVQKIYFLSSFSSFSKTDFFLLESVKFCHKLQILGISHQHQEFPQSSKKKNLKKFNKKIKKLKLIIFLNIKNYKKEF